MTASEDPLGQITEQELVTQPEMWRIAMSLPESAVQALPAAGEPAIVFGCGTSYYIGQSYAYLRNDAGLGRTRAAIPRERTWVEDDEHIVVISRSGTTVDVVDIVNEFRHTHKITAILGDLDTPLAQLCDRVVDLSFANEVSVVQTRFATTALTTLRTSIGKVSDHLISDAAVALELEFPADPTAINHVVFLGHRYSAGLAQEAALKLRESAGMWTEAYPSWEYEHGPISCASSRTLVWALEPLSEKIKQSIAATGATLYENDLDPQASVVLAHRMAVAFARLAGRNPDHPPFLNRSVVVA